MGTKRRNSFKVTKGTQKKRKKNRKNQAKEEQPFQPCNLVSEHHRESKIPETSPHETPITNESPQLWSAKRKSHKKEVAEESSQEPQSWTKVLTRRQKKIQLAEDRQQFLLAQEEIQSKNFQLKNERESQKAQEPHKGSASSIKVPKDTSQDQLDKVVTQLKPTKKTATKLDTGPSAQPQVRLDDLPIEILLHIFSFFSIRHLCAISLVNKRLKDLSEDGKMWRDKYLSHWIERRTKIERRDTKNPKKWKEKREARLEQKVLLHFLRNLKKERSKGDDDEDEDDEDINAHWEEDVDTLDDRHTDESSNHSDEEDHHHHHHQDDHPERTQNNATEDFASEYKEYFESDDDEEEDEDGIKWKEKYLMKYRSEKHFLNGQYTPHYFEKLHQGAVYSLHFFPSRYPFINSKKNNNNDMDKPQVKEDLHSFTSTADFWERILVSGGGDGAIKLWNMETKKEIQQLEGHDGFVRCVQLNKMIGGGGGVISGSGDSHIRLWDIGEGGKCISDVKAHEGTVWCVKNGEYSVYWEEEERNKTEGGHQESRRKRNHKRREGESHLFVSGGEDGEVKLWDTRDMKKCVQRYQRHEGGVYCVQYNITDELLCSAGQDGIVRWWDIRSGICFDRWHVTDSWIYSIQFDHHKFALGGFDSTVQIWNKEDNKSAAFPVWKDQRAEDINRSNAVRGIQFDHSKLISGFWDGTLRVYSLDKTWKNEDAQKNLSLKSYKKKKKNRGDEIFLDNSNNISSPQVVRRVNTDDDELKIEFEQRLKYPNILYSFQFDDWKLISGSSDGGLYFWDFFTGDPDS